MKIKEELDKLANPEKAKLLARYFKTGRGEYGEGDKFLGITVPEQRKVARKYKDAELEEVKQLITSKIHEHRLTGLMILVEKFPKADVLMKKKIIDFYLSNTKHVNNWDLVDLSAPRLLGAHLLDNDRKILYKLAKSKNIWEKRIAVLASFTLINNKEYEDSLKLAEMLLHDKHDLMHKAVGWMLREIGNKDKKLEVEFLNKHYKKMPRTMLRYAIEKFPEKERKFYMKK